MLPRVESQAQWGKIISVIHHIWNAREISGAPHLLKESTHFLSSKNAQKHDSLNHWLIRLVLALGKTMDQHGPAGQAQRWWLASHTLSWRPVLSQVSSSTSRVQHLYHRPGGDDKVHLAGRTTGWCAWGLGCLPTGKKGSLSWHSGEGSTQLERDGDTWQGASWAYTSSTPGCRSTITSRWRLTLGPWGRSGHRAGAKAAWAICSLGDRFFRPKWMWPRAIQTDLTAGFGQDSELETSPSSFHPALLCNWRNPHRFNSLAQIMTV